MKGHFLKYFALLAFLLLPLSAMGQGKVYTKSNRIADFPTKTTKVVLTGQPILDALLKAEFTSRWRISPYEFCDDAEFEQLRNGSLYYFVHFASDDEFTYMFLSKGGPVGRNVDPLKKATDVVSIPISAAGTPSSDELVYLPAFIDMIQEYVLKAMVSDRVAYSSIKAIMRRNKRGKILCENVERGRELFLDEAPGYIVPVVIEPSPEGPRKHRYEMQVSTDNHILYSFKKSRLH